MSQRDNPFRELQAVFEELTDQRPPVDVVDDGDRFVAVVDLPGFAVDEIDVQLDGERTVRIHAKREEQTATDASYVRRERRKQSIDRTITLPSAVDTNQTEASYDTGVLTIRLDKQSAGDAGTSIDVT